MKKHNISQFLKSKSFFVVLFVAIVAIASVTVVGINLMGEDSKKENLVDLNTPIDVVEGEQTDVAEGSLDAANQTDAATNENVGNENYTNDELLEYDVESYTDVITEDQTVDVAEEETNVEVGDIVATEEETQTANGEESEEETLSVMQPKVTADQLRFSSESVITWPVKGDVIKPFSIDNVVSFPTLNEWKTNPAIMISSEVGTPVVAATKGIVSKIEEDKETGTTVTMAIGDGYEVVYGQLSDITCKTGELVSEGTVIGNVAEPTNYYSVEGSNLYLQLLCNGEPVNPMLFLASE